MNIINIILDKVDVSIAKSEKLHEYYERKSEYCALNMNTRTIVNIFSKRIDELY